MTADDLALWLERYGDAWVKRDPDAAAALFSETAKYYEKPFDPPFVGRDAIRDYWCDVPKSQTDITFDSSVLCASTPASIVRWRAAFTRIASGQKVELDGIFLLAFDEAGACTELREWWHTRP